MLSDFSDRVLNNSSSLRSEWQTMQPNAARNVPTSSYKKQLSIINYQLKTYERQRTLEQAPPHRNHYFNCHCHHFRCDLLHLTDAINHQRQPFRQKKRLSFFIWKKVRWMYNIHPTDFFIFSFDREATQLKVLFQCPLFQAPPYYI